MKHRFPKNAVIPASLIGLCLLTGCTHIITEQTPYYEDGFAQVDPPQGELEAGTRVMILERKGSHARVLTGNLLDAWVNATFIRAFWEEDKRTTHPGTQTTLIKPGRVRPATGATVNPNPDRQRVRTDAQ